MYIRQLYRERMFSGSVITLFFILEIVNAFHPLQIYFNLLITTNGNLA